MAKNGGDHAPIIIKRKKVVKGGHHGGSWKIAYADFMTALMALFLVLWLLSQSDEEMLVGISEYFNTPLKVALTGGDQAAMTGNIIPGGGSDLMEIEGLKIRVSDKQSFRASDVQKNFFQLMQKIKALMAKDPELNELLGQVRFELNDDGLLIEFIDSSDTSMFDLGSAALAAHMKKLLTAIAPVINEVGHMMTITGHTDSIGFSAGETKYSNWELSVDRANSSRRALVAGGLRSKLINQVVGLADRSPAEGTKGSGPQNRRIALLIHGDLTIEQAKNLSTFK
jgi:chemotaxis protein MotB